VESASSVTWDISVTGSWVSAACVGDARKVNVIKQATSNV